MTEILIILIHVCRLLSDRNKLERYLVDAGYAEILGFSSPQSTPTPTTNDKFVFNESTSESIANRSKMSLPTEIEMPETERFVVELRKDSNGLGIKILLKHYNNI